MMANPTELGINGQHQNGYDHINVASREQDPIVVEINAPSTSNNSLSLPIPSSTNCLSNGNSVDSDESSEESYLDSLEEGRTPLLSGGDFGDDEFRHSDYLTTRRTNIDDDANEDLEAAPVKRLNHRSLPEDKWKAGIALSLLFVAALSNDIVLSFIHEKLPETSPLPDIAFEYIPYWSIALNISEYLMLTLFVTLMTMTFFHHHRWIVIRRIATVGSLLYFGRCVTMFVTQVPVADPNYYCSPKFSEDERTFWKIFLRGLRVLTGLGLNINGRHTLCGDYIYSGHTVVHVTCYLFIKEYSPKKWYILHYVTMIFASIGVLCLLISRGHYSIDVIIAYWITTRTFWEYHTLANIPWLRNAQQGRNHFIKSFWFPLFRFMESNVMRPVPRKYGIPFRLPYSMR